jgi:hypothetical protein
MKFADIEKCSGLICIRATAPAAITHTERKRSVSPLSESVFVILCEHTHALSLSLSLIHRVFANVHLSANIYITSSPEQTIRSAVEYS